MCLRYVRPDFTIRERFLCFAEATDLTGMGLSVQLLRILRECHIDTNNMVGQGYDGAAVMSGHIQKHIREQCPSAVYVHCASHPLNLCLLKASQVPDIRKALTVMHELAGLYCGSNKRLLHPQERIQEECPESTHTRLKMHCTTRWVEKQEAVRIFKERLPAIRVSLEQICIWPHQDCSGKALIFESGLNGAFLVVLEILSSVLEVTKPLSVKLQSESQDIHHAMEGVLDAVNVLQQLRYDGPAYDRIIQRAQELHGSEIAMPRMTGRQLHRANHTGSDTRQYYRREVFLPFIDV